MGRYKEKFLQFDLSKGDVYFNSEREESYPG